MLAGNVVALLSPLIFVPILTFAFGRQNYDWLSMAAIRLSNDTDIAIAAGTDLEHIPGAHSGDVTATDLAKRDAEQTKLKRSSVIAKSLTVFMAVSLLVLWPMPMYGSGYIFSKKFFTGWVVVGILWLFGSCFCVGLYPLWEGRHTMKRTTTGILLDLMGKDGRGYAQRDTARVLEGKEGSDVAIEKVGVPGEQKGGVVVEEEETKEKVKGM